MWGTSRARPGDEAARPAPAPPGTRFGLALFGLVMSVVGLVFAAVGRSWWAVALFAALVLLAGVDTTVQARRMRRHRGS